MRMLEVIGGPQRGIARCCNRSRLVAAAALIVAWFAATSVGIQTGAAAPSSMVAASSPPTIGGCQVFPADNVWNTRIDTLPAHPLSDTWINSVGRTGGLKADYGSGLWDDAP